MNLNLCYYGQLKSAAGVETETREYPDTAGIETVAKELSKEYGEQFQNIVLDEDNNLRPSIIILVNNTVINKNDPPDLKDGDEVKLLTAIAGG